MIATFTAAVVLAGCGGGGDPEGGPPSGKSPSGQASAAPSAAFADPPTRFDTGRPVTIPAELRPYQYQTLYGSVPVAISDRVAVTTTRRGELAGTDITTGRQAWKVAPSRKLLGGTGSTQPVVTTLQGRRTVLAAFLTEVPGQGTTPAGVAIELIGVDVSSGGRVLDDVLPVPRDSGYEYGGGGPVGIVGVDATTAVMTWAQNTTMVADLATHKVRWTRYGFDPVGLDGGVVAERTGDGPEYRMVGLRAADQRQVWASDEIGGVFVDIAAAGPGLFSLNVKTGSAGDWGTTDLHEVRTGKPRKHVKMENSWHCRFDEAQTVLCYRGEYDGGVVGLDATSLETLWRLPSEGRIAPKVTAFWHGAVYGETSNGPVVLDARSGKDREVEPGAAPLAVSGYGGLDVLDGGAWTVYPPAR
nr:PQQ-binding-like beta-propeller repeat protein [Actinomadura rugatobispora]